MARYNFNGVSVEVQEGDAPFFVATDTMGGSVSELRRPHSQIQREIGRGVWEDAYIYEVTSTGVRLVSQPIGEGQR